MWEFFSLINQQSTEGQSRKKEIWKIDVKNAEIITNQRNIQEQCMLQTGDCLHHKRLTKRT